MDIVIIGSGNVAAILGRKLRAAGHRILQVYSRNTNAASALAYEWDTESANYKSVINKAADVYLVAVSDDAIAEVADSLELPGKVVAHTAASVPKEVLRKVSRHYGVFYPLQTLRKEMDHLPATPVFIDGSDDFTRRRLESLAQSITDQKVVEAGDEDRLKLHIAAVLVSNFVNYLYVLAETYCRQEGINFKQLLPLIEETALKVKTMPPHLAQTGPAIRHDEATIAKHLALLKDYPDLRPIYELFTTQIGKMH